MGMSKKTQNIITHSEDETIAFARDFSAGLSGGVVLLHGDLGMGKSVFSRAVIRILCDDDAMDVPSPTFTLVQQYDAQSGSIFHFDLYRLSDESEIYELGWDDAMNDGIALVEWPERLGYLRPQKRTEVFITPVENAPDSRKIEIIYYE